MSINSDIMIARWLSAREISERRPVRPPPLCDEVPRNYSQEFPASGMLSRSRNAQLLLKVPADCAALRRGLEVKGVYTDLRCTLQ